MYYYYIQVFHLWLQVLDKHHKMFAKKQVSLDLVALGIFYRLYPLGRVVYTTFKYSASTRVTYFTLLSNAVTRTEHAVCLFLPLPRQAVLGLYSLLI